MSTAMSDIEKTEIKEVHSQQMRDAKDASVSLLQNAMTVKVSLRKPTPTRKIKSDATVQQPTPNLLAENLPTGEEIPIVNEKVNADRTLLHLSKTIFTCPEYDQIVLKDREIIAYLNKMCLKPAVLGSKVWVVPMPQVGEVDHVLWNFFESRAGLVQLMCDRWPEIVEQSKEKLGDLADIVNYAKWPNGEVLKTAFSMTWDYVTDKVDEKLKVISAEMYARQEHKIEERVAQAAEELTWALREQTSKLIDHMVKKLTSKSNGKVRQFKDDEIESAMEFFNQVRDRNVTGDTALNELVSRAKALVEGVHTDVVRNDETLREEIRGGFEEVAKAFDEMLKDAPSRKLRFDIGEAVPE